MRVFVRLSDGGPYVGCWDMGCWGQTEKARIAQELFFFFWLVRRDKWFAVSFGSLDFSFMKHINYMILLYTKIIDFSALNYMIKCYIRSFKM